MRVFSWGILVAIVCSLHVPGSSHLAYGDEDSDPLAWPIDSDARKHLARANKLYGLRSFADAITEYKAGALLESAPVFDYDLGQSFRQLGEYKEAIWHYERFLSNAKPQGKLLDAVNNFISQMRGELSKKAMTEKPVDPAPLPPLPRQPSVAAPRLAPQSQEPRSTAWYKDPVGLSLAGAGLISVGIGSGLIISARAINNEANSTSSQAESSRLHDKANTRNLIGFVTAGAGAGLLLTGILRLTIHASGPDRISLETEGNRNMLVLRGNF